MEKVRKINVTTMVHPDTLKKLAELSRKTGKSISSLIREAVEEWLSEVEQHEA
jgi:predicted DNA-binding protein